MKQVAEEMGVGHTFGLAPVGVFFGPAGQHAARLGTFCPGLVKSVTPSV
jgi:hypothetical protein